VGQAHGQAASAVPRLVTGFERQSADAQTRREGAFASGRSVVVGPPLVGRRSVDELGSLERTALQPWREESEPDVQAFDPAEVGRPRHAPVGLPLVATQQERVRGPAHVASPPRAEDPSMSARAPGPMASPPAQERRATVSAATPHRTPGPFGLASPANQRRQAEHLGGTPSLEVAPSSAPAAERAYRREREEGESSAGTTSRSPTLARQPQRSDARPASAPPAAAVSATRADAGSPSDGRRGEARYRESTALAASDSSSVAPASTGEGRGGTSAATAALPDGSARAAAAPGPASREASPAVSPRLVQVKIGRVIVRAPAREPKVVAPPPAAARLSLSDYLARRNGDAGRRRGGA
jgi:hypothetical protein